MSKLIKLFTLNICSFLHVSYTSEELFKSKKKNKIKGQLLGPVSSTGSEGDSEVLLGPTSCLFSGICVLSKSACADYDHPLIST